MNLHDLFKQMNLKGLQSSMQNMQEEIQQISVSGSSGGGMVQIEMNGLMEITSLTIDPEVLEEQDVTMLEDLVKAAINSMMSEWKEAVKQKTAGLPFAGNFGQ